MRITPLDVRKQEFRKAVRGFDCDEVRAFLSTLADEYETVLVDNKLLRERVLDQDDKIGEYKGMEQTLRDTLMTAERAMQETRENATREGGLIVQEAQMKARGIMEECRMRTEELRREIQGLRKEKETYLARFKGLAEAQIQFVETHQDDFKDLDKRLLDIVDSVAAGVRENIPPAMPPRAETLDMSPVADPAPEAINPPEAAAAPVAATAPAVDVWRDYNPVTGNDRASEEKPDEAPQIDNIEAPDPAESTLDNSDSLEDVRESDALTDEIEEVIKESLGTETSERV